MKMLPQDTKFSPRTHNLDCVNFYPLAPQDLIVHGEDAKCFAL